MVIEPPITTSVMIDKDSYMWYKQHDTSWRAIVKAGIRRLEEGERLLFLEEQLQKMKMEVSRSGRHKSMVWYIFKKYPDIYNEAREVVLREEEGSI